MSWTARALSSRRGTQYWFLTHSHSSAALPSADPDVLASSRRQEAPGRERDDTSVLSKVSGAEEKCVSCCCLTYSVLLSHHSSLIAAVYLQITGAVQTITVTKLCTTVSLKASMAPNGSASQYQSPIPTPIPLPFSTPFNTLPACRLCRLTEVELEEYSS